MSVGFTQNAVETKLAENQECYTLGAISGEGSDMDVQAT